MNWAMLKSITILDSQPRARKRTIRLCFISIERGVLFVHYKYCVAVGHSGDCT